MNSGTTNDLWGIWGSSSQDVFVVGKGGIVLHYNGDYDSDGIHNLDDNCPDDYNPDQIDTDTDGMGDVCDNNSYFPLE